MALQEGLFLKLVPFAIWLGGAVAMLLSVVAVVHHSVMIGAAAFAQTVASGFMAQRTGARLAALARTVD